MESEEISFILNGKQHIVPHNVHPATRLSDYIRQTALLKGTKVTCREGGCGVCVVTVEYRDHRPGKMTTRAINSCLCPIHIVMGWTITTTEGLGSNHHDGLHPIQQRMADYNATQCGFCTPGFVMSMFGLLKEKPQPSCDDVTNAMDGNLCRCTGYRSIMDAFQSFTSDGPNAKPIDIEDIEKLPCVRKPGYRTPRVSPVVFKNWRRPQSLSELYQILDGNKEKKNRLVFGNTASGVYKRDRYDNFVNIRDIPELYVVKADDKFLELGANLTLTELQDIFKQYKEKRGFQYLEKFISHIDTIGNKPVRNAGSWAGNLMMKKEHPEFISDMFTPMEALGAQIQMGEISGTEYVTPQTFLSKDSGNKVLLSMRLPALSDQEGFSVYKTMLRPQAAHAYITAAFKITFADLKSRLVDDVNIVYNGLNPELESHLRSVELYLKGRSLTNYKVSTECLQVLAKDLQVSTSTKGLVSEEYRTHLAQNLLYKFLCQFVDNGVHTPPTRLERPLASGMQDYETIPEQFPVTQNVSRISGKIQVSGETVYVDDLPKFDNELVALIVHSKIGKGVVDNIDTTAATDINGVVDVLTPDNIQAINPGKTKKILNKVVEYNGQPIALVLADDLGVAYRAAAMLKVTYKDVQRPILTPDEARRTEGYVFNEFPTIGVGDTTSAMKSCTTVLEGEFEHGYQYHFYLENQGCLVAPREGTYKVWSSTQFTDTVQQAIAGELGIVSSSVHVTVPRVGGAFGGKGTNAELVAVLAALGVAKTNRPVRLTPSLESTIKTSGHRPGLKAFYKVGVDEEGMIQAMEVTVYWNCGLQYNFFHTYFPNSVVMHADGVYHIPNTLAKAVAVKTDVPTTSPMRSPGQLPAHLLIEHVMDHVTSVLNVDPIAFRQKHLCREGQMMMCGRPMPVDNPKILWDAVMISADVLNRQKNINNFNKDNKWVKRGLAIVPSKLMIRYTSVVNYTVHMAVYHHDGSVVISHGGIEFGQGLDTKLLQIVMRELKIPKEMITVEWSNTLTAPNTASTGGSLTTEHLCRTVQLCCDSLQRKLSPFREAEPEAGWASIVAKARMKGVHLAATERFVSDTQDPVMNYPVLGVCVAEAEVDILTGENQILRADMHMDIGQSINPEIDVGQIEGALLIGLGMMLREKEVHHSDSGEILTASTWDYKIPTIKDTPADFRISILKGKPNKSGIFSAKAMGEPPICCSPVFLHAVKAAIEASRRERGKDKYFPLYAPATPDKILQACDIGVEEMA